MQNTTELLKNALSEIRRLKESCKTKGANREPAAIIGMACRFPGGINTPEEYWRVLCEGESVISDVPEERWNEYNKEKYLRSPYLKKAGFLKENIEEFDTRLFRLLPNEVAYMDPQQRLALKVCWELFENAGYSLEELKGKRVGVFAGVVQNDFGYENYLRNDETMNITGIEPSFLPGRISYFFGFTGPSMLINTACSSSAVALDSAVKYLNDYDCDMAVVCGANIMFSPETTKKISSLGILSKDCEVRTFDKNADGTVRGEGVAAILLKRLSDAERDGDNISSIVAGSAINQDGESSSITAPNGMAQMELLRAACKKSGVSIDEIGYIETHGTGTKLGDPIEVKAIADCLGTERTIPLYIGSVKTNIGHLEGAAGIASIIKTALMLKYKKIPKSLNCDALSEYINWSSISVKVADKLINWNIKDNILRTAGVSSFGLSGTNVHIIMQEYKAASKDKSEEMPRYPFIFTATSKESLKNNIASFYEFIRSKKQESLTSLSYMQNITRAALQERACISVSSMDELEKTLSNVVEQDFDVSYIERKVDEIKQVVFVFTGQGSQYNYMCHTFYENNPVFKEKFDECDNYYRELTKTSLAEIVFSAEYNLAETRYTQPTIFACEYALAHMWMSYGISPDLVLGHSIGEYVAACIAEIISVGDAMKLVIARGNVMEKYSPKGKMVAVFAEREMVENLIKNVENVYISLSNSSEQTVIAGTVSAMEGILQQLEQNGMRYSVLDTTRPFHTPLMEQAALKFRTYAEDIKYNNPKIKIISNITSKAENTRMAQADYWVEHIVSEVRFYDSVKGLGDFTNKVFLEIGTSPVLTGIISKISDGTAICEYSASKKCEAKKCIIEVLSKMFVSGVPVNLKKLYEGYNAQLCSIPNYCFDKKRIPYIHNISGGASEKTLEVSEQKETNEDSVKITDSKPRLKSLLASLTGINMDEINEKTNLLKLGIDSVNAIKIISDVHRIFGVKLNLNAIFDNSTFGELVKLINVEIAAKDNDEDTPTVITINEKERYQMFPLNEIQYAYWAGRDNRNMLLSQTSCCAYFEADLHDLKVKHFVDSLRQLEERHDMLRCRITEDAKQYIVKEAAPEVIIYDSNDIMDIQEHLESIRKEMSELILPLGGPLYQVRLSKLHDNAYRMHFHIDFMIADAMSLYIFMQDLEAIYNGQKLKKLEITYRDYQNYIHSSDEMQKKYREDEAFWMEKIEDFPKAPELPLNKASFVSGAERTFVRREKRISSEEWKNFTNNVSEYNITPSAALFTLYSEVLSAFGGGSSFAVMLTVFKRHNINSDIEKIIGDFTKLALVEVYRKNISIAENAVNIQKQMMQNISHSEYSAVDFTDKLKKHHQDERMYNVIFTSAIGVKQDTNVEMADGIQLRKHLKSIVSSTPQVCMDHQVFYENEDIIISWDTPDEVFMDGVVDAMFEIYSQLIDNTVNNSRFFETVLSDLRPKQQKVIHENVNSTEVVYEETNLLTAFGKNVAENSKSIALVVDGKEYTYGELDQKADMVAAKLANEGAIKGDRVLIELPKSFEQIYSVLGVLKAGCIYVPLAYGQPLTRTKSIIEKSKPVAIIRNEYTEELGIKCYIPENFVAVTGERTVREILPTDGAYIIYTSGSTGVPKGVYITHGAAMNTIMDVNKKYDIGLSDRTIGISALSFDLSVYDIFGILSAGGTLVLPTEEQRIDPKSQCELVSQNKVTVWNSVPTIMDIYTDFLKKKSLRTDSLRRVILSGDWIPLNLPDKMQEVLPLAALTSMGGATEASIWSNYYDVDKVETEWNSVPYGYPLANQRFYILDEYGRRCPDWVAGRLHIAGKGLADCYYNEAELTKKAFYNSEIAGERVYDTGDYGRYLPEGIIEFLGRKDGQIKINGYRIEIAEIESALKKCGITKRTYVLPVGERVKKIVAFIETNEKIQQEEIKDRLKVCLPTYFIPEYIIGIEKLPITENGKVDAKQLVIMFENLKEQKLSERNNEVIGEINPILKHVRRILEIADITEADSFGQYGVSSVDMIHLADELESIYGIRPSISKMLNYQSIAELIEFFANVEEVKTTEVYVETSVKRCYESPVEKCNPTEKYKALGIDLYVEDGKLKFKAAKGIVTGEILEELKAEKASIISYLKEENQRMEHEREYNEKNAYELTPIQKAYLLGRSTEYELGGTSAHYYTELEWKELDIVKLEKAVNSIIDNHDMLQTVILPNGMQVRLREVPYYRVVSRNVSENEALDIRKEWEAHIYEIGVWPMFDVFVSKLDNGTDVVHFSFDCMLLDGWSANMMINEIFNAYMGREIMKPAYTFREYVKEKDLWLEKKDYFHKAKLFWNERALSLPPAPQLPYRAKLDEVMKPHFARKRYVLPKAKTLKLNEKIKEYSMTASAIVCTAYMRIISDFGKSDNFSLNLTLFNRLPLNREVGKLLGDFTNITLIPYHRSKSNRFIEEAEEVRDFIVKAVENRTYNGLELLRNFAGNDVFKAVMPVVFTSELFGSLDAEETSDVLKTAKEIYAISQTPQVALDHQALLRNGELVLVWDYVTELFDDEVISEIFDNYVKFIEVLADSENWDSM